MSSEPPVFLFVFLLDSHQVEIKHNREAPKTINNYKIIHKQSTAATPVTSDDENNSVVYYLYGKEECLFPSIPSILQFYSTHYLNQSPLVKPVSRTHF